MSRTYYEISYTHKHTLHDGRNVDRRKTYKRTFDKALAEATATDVAKEFGNAQLETIELDGLFDTVIDTKEYAR